MLSKKMTFSLMSLITLLAFAFVAPSALAGEFATTPSVTDVSFAGDNQVELAESIEVSVKFDKGVDMSKIAANVSLVTTNKFGGVIPNVDMDTGTTDVVEVVTVAQKDLDPDGTGERFDGLNFTLTFTLNPTPSSFAATANDNDKAYKSVLRVAKGLVAVAIGDVDTSKDGDITIFYVGADVTGVDSDSVPNTQPRPVSIALSSRVKAPAAGFKGETFEIIVTLSEMPKEGVFPAARLTVANGTASDGIYLGAVDPDEDNTGGLDTDTY